LASTTLSPAPTLKLRLLGGFAAEAGDTTIALPTRKARALLAYLALAPQRSQEREKLSGLFWGETGKEQAQQSLRQALFAIRKALPGCVAPVLVTSARTVTLDPQGTSVDALELEQRLRDPTRGNLEAAAALYRGELLDGCTVEEPGFDEWLSTERGRLAELTRSGLERLARLQGEEGALDSAVQTRLHLQRLDPWAEENHRALMLLYVKQGRRASALAHYQACAATLEKELGVAPEPATRKLYDELVAGPAPAVINRAPAPALARLIGREAERERLFEALAAAWSGGGRVGVLIGEAGVGKTRLLEELAARARELGGRIVRGRAFESEQVLPFAVWVDALRGDGTLLEGPTFEALPLAWQAELSRLAPRAKTEPGFTPSPESVLRLFEAITGLLGRVAERAPLLLLLDDLHWADESSLRLLAFVGRHLSKASRILIAVTAREEELARAPFLPTLLRELSREDLSSTTEVRPLSEAETAALVHTLALPQNARDDPGVLSQIWAVSEGNPFVVLEVVRALAHGAPIDGVSRLSVPERVREVVAGHIARLSPFERDLSAIAAVIGREFEFALLRTASGQDDVAVASAVEQLARAAVLREQADKLYFTHDRIREVVYDGLLPQRRTVLHGCVARALEAEHAADTDAVSSQLAFHYARANEPRAAVDYLTRFAESAARTFGLNEALAALAEASELTERLPAAERPRWRIEIAVRQANSLAYLGRFAEIEPCLAKHQSNLDELNRLELTSQFHFWLGFNHSLVGNRTLAAHHIELALDGAERCGDAKTKRRAHGLLAYELGYASRYQAGIEHGLKATADPESGEPEYVALGFMNLGLNYLPIGRHHEALDAFERSRAVAQKAGIPRVEALALSFSGLARAQLGEYETALRLCKEAVQTACDPVSTMATYSVLAHAYVECNRPDEALEILPNVTIMAETFGMRGSEALAHIASADAYLLKGDAETARRFAERGLSTSRAIGEPRNEGRSLTAAARCAIALGEHELAADQLATARRILEAIGADYDLGLCLCTLGALDRARGNSAAAKLHYAGATQLFRSHRLEGPAACAAAFDAEITHS
jgi:DNA-binding SARP family transcriptional activator